MADDPILTSETGRILEISSETVRAWSRRGVLKARRTTSGVRVFSREEVEQLRRSLDEQRVDTEPRPNRTASPRLDDAQRDATQAQPRARSTEWSNALSPYRRMVSQNFGSWNQMARWLRGIDGLRNAG